MIYQDVKRYLKHTLLEPKINFTWSSLDNIQFFTFIDERYTSKDFEKEISEVKIAFKDFFEPVGNIVFRYKEESGIKFKIFPYSVHPKDSKHLKNIIKIINNNRKHIKYPYKGQNDQIAILGKIRREVNREVSDPQESVNTKELIKYAVRQALDLGENDIITQLKRKYIVKIFEKNTSLDVEEEVAGPVKREGIHNRYNGYTVEEIEETYKEIFEKGEADIERFLKDAMKIAFNGTLDFNNINNKFYEEKSLKIIHAAIAKELINYTALEDDYLLGITGFLMRKNFYKIHEIMAGKLIECIYDKNQNANQFLLFYNGNTILMDNEKYKIPSLETEDGKQWNNASLIGICNLWMNTKNKKIKYENRLLDNDMKILKLEEKLSYIKPEKDFQEEALEKASEKAEKAKQVHMQIEAKLNYLENANLNSTEYFAMKEKYKKSLVQFEIVRKDVEEASSNIRAIKDANMSTYTELEYCQNQKKQLLHDVKAQNLNIGSKSAQIDPIIKSIISVLMDRTKRIKDDED